MQQTYNYKKGLTAIFFCYLLWGSQPLYWNLCKGIDTFFMLASRIVWASVACLVLLRIQGKLDQYAAVFKNRSFLMREIPCMLLLFADWAIYLWAVSNGRVLECALGYYIQPVVIFLFGALIYKEKINWKHGIVIALIVVGIFWSAKGFNGVPWVTIALAFLFSIYTAIKKSLPLDSIVSTSCEITLMLPISIFMILAFYRGDNGVAGLDLPKLLLVMGSGIVTAAPMLLFSISLANLPLTTNAGCQYLSPTISIFCGAVLGEVLTKDKLISFIFIWAAIVIYTVISLSDIRGSKDNRPAGDS